MENTKIVLLNNPIWIVVNKRAGIRKIIEVWGFKIDFGEYTREDINNYVAYLLTASKWEQAGGEYDVSTGFIAPTGEAYGDFDEKIEQLKRRSNITWLLYETRAILDKNTKGMYENFLISKQLYDNILEYGSISEPLDVENQ